MFIKYITTIKNLVKEDIKIIEPFASGAYFTVGRKDVFDKYCEILDTFKILAERCVDAAIAFAKGALWVLGNEKGTKEYLHNRNFISALVEVGAKNTRVAYAFALGLRG